MRDLTDNDLQKIHIEKDMLRGNLNRMCITDDIEEFMKMQTVAISRLNNIFKICAERLTEESEG